MAIKDIGNFQQTLDTQNARGWSRQIDNKPDFNFEVHAPGLESPLESGKTFGDFLKESVSQVNSLQQEANIAMEKLASGESQNLHETLLAVEKAEVSFKMMNQVRSKVLDAYRDIMKMQI